MAAENSRVRQVLDGRLRAVEWRDLLPLTRREVVCETLIAAPWLAGSLVGWHLAETSHPGFAAAALLSAFFFFFLTGLHNAYHHALGLGRWLTDLTMVALSVSMLSAMHAIQATHLHHHRHCLDEADVEGGRRNPHGGEPCLVARRSRCVCIGRAGPLPANADGAGLSLKSLPLWRPSPRSRCSSRSQTCGVHSHAAFRIDT
jgi:hypothetical protein